MQNYDDVIMEQKIDDNAISDCIWHPTVWNDL